MPALELIDALVRVLGLRDVDLRSTTARRLFAGEPVRATSRKATLTAFGVRLLGPFAGRVPVEIDVAQLVENAIAAFDHLDRTDSTSAVLDLLVRLVGVSRLVGATAQIVDAVDDLAARSIDHAIPLFSRAELAMKLDVSRERIQCWLSGKQCPPVDVASRIAAAVVAAAPRSTEPDHELLTARLVRWFTAQRMAREVTTSARVSFYGWGSIFRILVEAEAHPAEAALGDDASWRCLALHGAASMSGGWAVRHVERSGCDPRWSTAARALWSRWQVPPEGNSSAHLQLTDRVQPYWRDSSILDSCRPFPNYGAVVAMLAGSAIRYNDLKWARRLAVEAASLGFPEPLDRLDGFETTPRRQPTCF